MPSDGLPTVQRTTDGAPGAVHELGGSALTEAATAETPAAQSVFQAARDQAAEKAMPGSFMTKEDRHEAFDNKTPFWLINTQLTKGQFGEQVQFHLVTDPSTAENGEFNSDFVKILALDYSPFRDELAKALNEVIARNKIVGPLYLTKFRTTSGHDAWDLTDEVPSDEIPY